MSDTTTILLSALGGVAVGVGAMWGVGRLATRRRARRRARIGAIHGAVNALPDHVTPDPVTSEYLDHVEAVCDRLLEGEQRLRAVLDALVEGLALFNSESRVVFCNPAFTSMFHCSTGQAVPLDALTSDTEMVFRHALRSVQEQGKPATCEIRLTTTPPRDIMLTMTPYRDVNLPGAIILSAFDVTQRKRIEQIRTEFVANVSHELRTPLAAIRGYVETCLETAADGPPAPYARFLPIIQQHAIRLTALIEDLLILSRIESRGMQLKLMPMQASAALDSTIATLAPAAEKKRLALINALPPMLPDVVADQSALERILINLVENAIKYSEEDSEVRITGRLETEALCIMITDQGIGIPREDQARIFERFYRVDKARSRKAGGTGLGLSIVKHLVQAQGGEVWVDSEVGRGSTFLFTVPLDKQSRGNGSASEAGSAQGARLR